MRDKEFVRCVQCGQEWPSNQKFAQLTDDHGVFLPKDRQLVLPMLVVVGPVRSADEAKAKALCHLCHQKNGRPAAEPLAKVLSELGRQPVERPLPRFAKPSVPSLIVLPVNLVAVNDSPPVQVKPAPAVQPKPRPVRLAAASRPAPALRAPKRSEPPRTKPVLNDLADQIRRWEQERDEKGILPKPGPGQTSFYAQAEDGSSQFKVVARANPEVTKRLDQYRSLIQRINRAYALTGQVIPETPLGLAQVAGPVEAYQDSYLPDSSAEPREVDEVFEDFQPSYPNWLSAPSPWLEVEDPSDQSAAEIADQQIFSWTHQDPDFLGQLEAFRDFLKSQNDDIQ
ncbi:hypothetical protein KJ611_02865 [Patescibacteria group bacterium]|nr:hypothetical protein [Patescibacteria group bacterium]MBU1705224.1 hypothetical protein [Patescibacteria group bacterium]